MCTGTKTKHRGAIKARRVHQPSWHRNRHRRLHRTPAATTAPTRAPQTIPLDKAPRHQRTRSNRHTTPNHAPAPQTAHPTVHNPIRVSVDALCALRDCALGISPVTSYSGVKKDPKRNSVHCDSNHGTWQAASPVLGVHITESHDGNSVYVQLQILC